VRGLVKTSAVLKQSSGEAGGAVGVGAAGRSSGVRLLHRTLDALPRVRDDDRMLEQLAVDRVSEEGERQMMKERERETDIRKSMIRKYFREIKREFEYLGEY